MTTSTWIRWKITWKKFSGRIAIYKKYPNTYRKSWAGMHENNHAKPIEDYPRPSLTSLASHHITHISHITHLSHLTSLSEEIFGPETTSHITTSLTWELQVRELVRKMHIYADEELKSRELPCKTRSRAPQTPGKYEKFPRKITRITANPVRNFRSKPRPFSLTVRTKCEPHCLGKYAKKGLPPLIASELFGFYFSIVT